MSADRLKEARQQVEAGEFALAPDARRAVLSRIDDLLGDIVAAERALSKVPDPAIAEAAARTAHLFYIGGHGWRRFLAENSESARTATTIGAAVLESVEPILKRLHKAIAASKPAVVKRSNLSYSLTCSACGGDAVTFNVGRTGAEAPEQLVVSSLSPVTVFRPITGPRMQDLIALLDAGDARKVIQHMTETQPAGCDSFCPACDGVYCKEHTAVEAQWSGSWHESTFATCPLGHEREIE